MAKNEKIWQELKALCAEIQDYNGILELLEWDQQVYLPTAAGSSRALQVESISRRRHELASGNALGDLLAALEPELTERGEWNADSDDAALFRQVKREYERSRRVPAAFAGRFSRICAEGFDCWYQAKERNDFATFAPVLEEIFQLRKEYAGFFPESNSIYDPLLDEFEPGMSTAEVARIMDFLRAPQRDLVREIVAGQQSKPDWSGKFPLSGQRQLSEFAARCVGFDFTRGRLDEAEHPFTSSFALDDVRITTHYFEDNVLSALYSTLHESGHALYEQRIDRKFARSPLGTGASLAIHESQSRLWENMVGRSRSFSGFLFGKLQALFPEETAHHTADDFYRAINFVEPSPIRTEADEVTYNLHIMLRFELENAVLNGDLAVRDLNTAWRDAMRRDLGLELQNDREGVLQDVHWATGAIGYFPTYLLGNVIAAQCFALAEAALPDLDRQLACGENAPLRKFLSDRIYCHGAKYFPLELLKQAGAKQGIDPQIYLNYLNHKYLAK